MVKKARTGISYASKRDDLPGEGIVTNDNVPHLWRAFAGANDGREKSPERSARMVVEDQPYPHPRPSPELAAEVDAMAFNTRWQKERSRARHAQNQHDQNGDPSMTDNSDAKARPSEPLREGPLKAAIWRIDGKNGAYHTVTLARSYKDEKGEWQDTKTFRSQDMLGLSELTRRAHHEVQELDQEAFKEKRRTAPTPQRVRDDDRR